MQVENDVHQKISVGALQGLIGTFGGRFLTVLGGIIAARILGPAAYGLYAIGWTLFRFLSLLYPLGMDRCLLRYGPMLWKKEYGGFKNLINKTMLLSLGSGLIFGLVLFLLSPWLADSVYHKSELTHIFRFYSIAIPVSSLLVVGAAATRITQRVKISVLVQDLGQPLLGLSLMVVLVFLGLTVMGVVIADVVSFCVAAIVIIFFTMRIFPELRKIKSSSVVSTKEILSYSIPAALGGAFSVYIFWVDRLLVGYFLPSFENGIYLAVSQISTIFSVISSGINTIAIPMFSDLIHEKDEVNLQEVFRISTKWSIYFSIPIIAVLLISPETSLSIIYGASYRSGTLLLTILLIGQIVNLITGPVNPLLIVSGNHKYLFWASAFTLGISILLNIITIPVFGVTGAALSTSFSLSLLYLAELVWVKHKLNLWPYDKRFVKGILASIGAILTVFLIKKLVPTTETLSLIFQIIGSVVSYIFILYLVKIDPEDRAFMNNLIIRYKK